MGLTCGCFAASVRFASGGRGFTCGDLAVASVSFG